MVDFLCHNRSAVVFLIKPQSTITTSLFKLKNFHVAPSLNRIFIDS